MAIGGAKLDVNGIVGQLMSIEQRPLAALNKKEADYQAKISAYGGISGALSTFQSAVQELSKPDKFKTTTATSSDPDTLTASASDKAAGGSYSLSVSALAQGQKLATPGQTSDTANIGSGSSTTITFDFGSISGGSFDSTTSKYNEANFTSNGQGIKTLTIDASNNTLQGIRDAINNAKIGIKASIVNNGTDTPYVLSLSPENIGSNNSLKISVDGDEEINKLLAHDPSGIQNLNQNVTAQNAKFSIDGVNISKDSNTISEVIPGVTLELKATSDDAVKLSIANDSAAVTTSVQAFVKSFNDLNKTLQDVSSYNAATKESAVLQGDSTVRLLQSQIRNILNTPIKNSASSLTTLSQIGISIQKDGSMALDTGKLDAAIKENPNDVASLFTTVGKSSDSKVAYSSASTFTDAGSFPVVVTQLSTQGSLGSCEEIESRVIEAGENDTLNVTINGVNASVVLSPGEYSFDGLANEIQSKINGAPALSAADASVSVKHDDFGMIITSKAYGSKSTVSVSGNGAFNLFGSAPVIKNGVDVAGTINGTPAIGNGQVLSAENGIASGLTLLVDGGPLGPRGKINYSQGYAHTLNNFLTAVLAKDGQLESRKKGINSSIKDIDHRRDTIQQRLPLQEARLRKQYASLETMLSKMDKTSEYLSQQLANLPK